MLKALFFAPKHNCSGVVKPQSFGKLQCLRFIQQFKGALGPLGTYLRVNGGTLHQLGGDTVATGIYGKWMNIKVAWDIPTGTGRVWINNCLKTTVHGTKGSTWYFKFGTYTCNSAKCTAHFKNIHLYQKGATDPYNVKSPIR